MSFYECQRCFYKTRYKNDMRKHLNIKQKCMRKNITCQLSNEDLDKLSLQKNFSSNFSNININDENEEFEESKKKDKLDKLDKLYKLDKLDKLDKLNNLNKSETKIEDNTNNSSSSSEKNIIHNINLENAEELICEYCSKKFSRKYNLKIHLDTRCKEKKELPPSEINSNPVNTNIIYNTINNTTNNNIMVNIIMNPFESKFDTSHIDDLTKMDLIINILYTKALEHILENKNNLNLLVEEGHDTAIVYKNDVDKFVRMKKENFTESIMKNMKGVLSDMNDEIQKNPYLTKRIDELIELKYKNYIEEKKTNEMVNDMICKIYDQKKMEIKELFKNTNNDEDVIIY